MMEASPAHRMAGGAADRAAMEVTMRSIPFVLTAVLALAPAAMPLAAEGQGLAPSRDRGALTGWQGRMAVGAPAVSLPGDLAGDLNGNRLTGVSLVGDYYFGIAPRWDAGGGLRASGGVLWGSRLLWAGAPALGAARPGLSVARQWASTAPVDAGDASTLPYVGLGYSGMLGAGRFGYSADVGIVARSPGNAVRLGRVLGGSQSFEDALRDLRLAPVLQLGVSYAF